MKSVRPLWFAALLGVLAITTAACLELPLVARRAESPGGGTWQKLLGDGRRLFAGQFVEMADVYLHSGFYPSIFDQRGKAEGKAVLSGAEDHDDHDDHSGHEHDEHGHCAHDPAAAGHQCDTEFMGKPQDWLARFIRRFRITEHTHLEGQSAKEILPWLKVAIELDPHAISTYTATAFWLRKQLQRPADAEVILREGIHHNRDNPELLYEMGRIYLDEYQQSERARAIWLGALKLWERQTESIRAEDSLTLGKIAISLAHLARDAGNLPEALRYFELARSVSPNPSVIQQQMDDFR